MAQTVEIRGRRGGKNQEIEAMKRMGKLLGKAAKGMYLSIKKNPQMLNPPPSVMSAKEYYNLYRKAPDDVLKASYLEKLADILTKFRVVCSDYRFFKILRKIGINKKFAIHLMAYRLGFEPGQEKQNG